MRPEFLCHLPFLRLPQRSDQALADGARLVALPYEEWLALEDPAMDYHERRYRTVAPVFVRALLPDGPDAGALTAAQERAAEEIIERSHTAAMLALPANALAAPALSAAYVAWRGLPCNPPREGGWFCPPELPAVAAADDDGIQLGRIVVWLQQPPPGGGPKEQWIVERRFGPAQREWLLSHYANEADALSPDAVQAFARHYDRLDRAAWGPRRAAAVRCADVVTTLVTPGNTRHDAIVLLVAALENLVNAAAERPLGDTFARRCAAWFAETPAERTRDQLRFRRLYAARSEILHGADPDAAVRALGVAIDATNERDLFAWLRLHAWIAVDGLVGWYGSHPDDDGGATQFQRALATVASADVSWSVQRAALLEGRTHVRG
ncbi:hypothetical protein [Horticoccus sp. 23ND18S-11]|uniref:hypothetical protein n=1 Tax=Horticoccus sp. 23ND18S-11 TaxID=3391832 RepID=UPI0039C9289A